MRALAAFMMFGVGVKVHSTRSSPALNRETSESERRDLLWISFLGKFVSLLETSVPRRGIQHVETETLCHIPSWTRLGLRRRAHSRMWAAITAVEAPSPTR